MQNRKYQPWAALLAMLFLAAGSGLRPASAQVTPGTPTGTTPKADVILKPVADSASDELTIAADRPGFSTPTGIVPLGHFQLEAGATAARSGTDRGYSLGQLLVRVPVCQQAEVQVGVPSYLVARSGGQRVTGGDDLAVAGKVRLSTATKAVYDLLLSAALPTGSRAVAEHKFQPGAALAADYVLGPKTGLTLNLGVSRASQNGQRYSQLTGAASLGFTLTAKTGAFVRNSSSVKSRPWRKRSIFRW